MRGAIDAASLCVTPDPTGVLGQLSTTLSELRNAFAGRSAKETFFPPWRTDMCWIRFRITSYNVCYTKLLRAAREQV